VPALAIDDERTEGVTVIAWQMGQGFQEGQNSERKKKGPQSKNQFLPGDRRGPTSGELGDVQESRLCQSSTPVHRLRRWSKCINSLSGRI